MANFTEHYAILKTHLQGLRYLIRDSKSSQGYLDLFDEFVRECEFGLALETLCDFLVEAGSPIDAAVLVQIDDLHKLMKVEDSCVEKLWKLAQAK